MNILYLTTVFPRPEDGSTIYTDLAEALFSRGHRLTVVVADEKKQKSPAILCTERGFKVLRVRTGNLYNVGLLEKGISTLTLSFRLKRAISRCFKAQKFDLILYETPPVSVYKTVHYAKKRFGASTFLMLKDIFPQNGADLGIYKKSSFLYRYFQKQEQKLYRVSDKIGCMSDANISYVNAHNPACAHKTVLFPNTKAPFFPVTESKESIRARYLLPADKKIFVFGGNIGLPQSPDYFVSCAKAILKEKDTFVLVVGRGSHALYVAQEMQDYSNFRVMKSLPRDTYETILSACDIGLIFLDRRFTVPNVPSRILSYMNAALPVLAATDLSSDIGALIEAAGCGFCCISESIDDYLALAKALLSDDALRHELGAQGYAYFQNHLTAEKSAQLLEIYTNPGSEDDMI